MDKDLKEIFKEIAITQDRVSKRTDELSKFQDELSKSIKELKDSQKELTESQKKTDAQLAKTDIKLAKFIERVDELSKMYGGTSNNQGKVAEEFFYNSLKHNPELDGIRFDYIRKNVTGSRNRIEEEYDIILVNGSIVYIIEVKYRLRKEDIDRYVERKLPNFNILFPEYKGFDIKLAFASFFIDDELVEYAREKGFLLLKRRGKVFDALAA